MIVVGFNIPNIIKAFDDGKPEKLVISDPNNIYGDELVNMFNKCEPNQNCVNYDVSVTKDNIDELKKKIEDEEIESAILVENDGITYNGLKFTYIVKNAMYVQSIPEDIYLRLTMTYRAMEISKLNLSDEDLAKINPNYQVEIKQTEEEAKGNVLAIMMLSIVLFYAVYFNAFQVSSAITTEKTSKIIETLVTSTSPKNIVIGKTLGIGVVGLFQLILLVGTAIFSAKTFMDPELINSLLDLSTITWTLGLITFVYFILGYLAYAVLYALTGSTVSKPEDVQSANGPVSLIGVACFYLAYFTMMDPASELNAFAAMFPFSSPFCMPLRLMMGLASTTDVLISLGILAVTIFVVAKIAIRIYSNAILNYGTKLSIKDIITLYKQK
jgi:ABC-2 type transport system permease protein